MTREEILEYFKDINHAYNDCTRYDTLKRMIDELQEPCNDCISRQDAINIVVCDILSSAIVYGRTEEGMAAKKAIVDGLKRLPSVTPAENPFADAKKYFDTIHNLSQTCDLPYSFVKDEIKEIMKALKTLPKEPCDDAISRQAVLNLAKFDGRDGLGSIIHAFDVEQLPPVNPAEKVGRWEWVQYDSNPNIGNWHCSECRAIIPHMPENVDNTPIYKWCPYCGAKMQEVKNDR